MTRIHQGFRNDRQTKTRVKGDQKKKTKKQQHQNGNLKHQKVYVLRRKKKIIKITSETLWLSTGNERKEKKRQTAIT